MIIEDGKGVSRAGRVGLDEVGGSEIVRWGGLRSRGARQ